jgi:hypothetical protein
METYRSKISPVLIVPASIVIGGIFILMLLQGVWLGALIIATVLAFVTHLFITTYYTIDGAKLQVKCGFLMNITIDISTITRIEATNTVLSSPALSFDRIEVFYNRYDSVVISPGDKHKFIGQLKAVNPAISSTIN